MKYSYQIKMEDHKFIKGKKISAELFKESLDSFLKFVNHVLEFNNLKPAKTKDSNFGLFLTDVKENCLTQVFQIIPYNNFADLRSFTHNPERETDDTDYIDEVSKADDEILENFSNLKNENYEYFKKKYDNDYQFPILCRDIQDFTSNLAIKKTFKIIDNKKQKPILDYRVSSSTKKIGEKWLEKLKIESPKLAGAYMGSFLRGNENDLKIQMEVKLINGEKVKFEVKEKEFKKRFEKLKFFDLIRIYGKYKKEPGRGTQAWIKDVKSFNLIRSEYKENEEEYRNSFKSEPDFNDPIYQDLIKSGYKVYKKNYAVLTLLGEE